MLKHIFSKAASTPHIDTYAPTTAPIFAAYGAMFGFSGLAAGYAMARSSRSKSVCGCACLSVLLQGALPLGLLIATMLAAVAALASNPEQSSWQFLFDGNSVEQAWQSSGLIKVFSLMSVSLFSVLVAAAGGMLGAAHNRRA